MPGSRRTPGPFARGWWGLGRLGLRLGSLEFWILRTPAATPGSWLRYSVPRWVWGDQGGIRTVRPDERADHGRAFAARASNELLSLVGQGHFVTVVSVPLLFEFEDTLMREAHQIHHTSGELMELLDFFQDVGRFGIQLKTPGVFLKEIET